MSLPTLNGKDNNKDQSFSLPDFDMPNINNADEFAEIDADQALTYESDDDSINEDIYEELEELSEEQELPVMTNSSDENDYADEDDYNPDYEEDLKQHKKSKFINVKKKKIIPFGGEKSKRKIRSSEFDDRKNVLGKTKIIRFLIMSAVVILFLLGLKNTFIPAHVYTGEQIKQFALEGAGKTGFPEERGAAFAENFLSAHLKLDKSNPNYIEALSHFYGVESYGAGDLTNLNVSFGQDARQQVIIEPKVFEVNLNTSYSAQYKLNAYVTDTSGVGEVGTGKWIAFVVNLYYNKDTDTLTVTKDSPSLIPSFKIGQQKDIPDRMPLGNGNVNDTIGAAINPTINGFIEAYASASVKSHDSILQYIDNKEDVDLYSGFGGTVELYEGPNQSIRKVIYDSDDGIYRVDVSVDWLDTTSSRGASEIVYTSRYIMRVKPIGDGKYAVSSFVPFNYYNVVEK